MCRHHCFETPTAIAERERFFHWTLEFPEVFQEAPGEHPASAGFDAIVCNPPWEMLRGERAAHDGAGLTDFARASGIYGSQGDGHANLFQLFLERGLMLVRRGGRVGFVLPSGFASDHGCAALRRHVLQRTRVDTFVSVENRDGLFPIHRALKFLLVTATADGSSPALACRFGVRSPDVLDDLPDVGVDPEAVSIPVTLMAQLSGEQFAVPELRTGDDLRIASGIAFTVPALNHPAGWDVAFGRELNATEDRRHFVETADRLAADSARITTPSSKASRSDLSPLTWARRASTSRPAPPGRCSTNIARTSRPRLAYRDVASSSNRLTLIAAIVPAHTVTTHTLFCLKGDVDADVQQFLCGVFNSFVANYLVRLRVGVHVTVSIVERLSVPVLAPEAPAFRRIVALATGLAKNPSDQRSAAMLQGLVARLYRLGRSDFTHILATFPLIPLAEREAALDAFDAER